MPISGLLSTMPDWEALGLHKGGEYFREGFQANSCLGFSLYGASWLPGPSSHPKPKTRFSSFASETDPSSRKHAQTIINIVLFAIFG